MAKFQRYLNIALIFCYGLLAISGAPVKLETEQSRDYPKLKFVNVIFRHGDRTPDVKAKEMYSNDPYANYNFYPNEDGYLTNVGKNRAYELGNMLRKKYGKFLGQMYYWRNVHARNTMLPRTKMTLQLVLAALYPPTGTQIWNPQLPWQPINTVYASTQDNLLLPFLCPGFLKDTVALLESPEVKKRTEKYSDLMKTVSKHTGDNITNVRELFVLYNILKVESSMGLELPEWTNGLFPDKFTDAVAFFFEMFNYNDDLIRRNGGILLRRIVDDMDKVINGSSTNLKLNLFSGHDMNVVTMLYALKLFDKHPPSFTSSVILELRTKGNKYFVRVLYYLGIPPNTKELKIPNCEVLCPYDKFVQLTSTLTGPREHEACPAGKNGK